MSCHSSKNFFFNFALVIAVCVCCATTTDNIYDSLKFSELLSGFEVIIFFVYSW